MTQCGGKDQSGSDYRDNDLIVFAGGTNISNMQYNGFLETTIQASFPNTKLRFRNLAWDGDTVFEQFRDLNFGSWQQNIDSLNAAIVFVQFGQMEALQGEAGIDSFVLAYRRLLDQIEKKGRQIIVISPIPFEPQKTEQLVSYGREDPLDNVVLEKYAQSVQRLAHEKNYRYIDLFNALKKNGTSRTSSGDHLNGGAFTSNGIHLNENGHKRVAAIIAGAIGLDKTYTTEMEPLRKEIIAKNEIWFNYWRPGNWAFLKGDRTHVEFSRDWQDVDKRIFPEEMKEFQPLLESSERRIYKLSAGFR